MLSRNCVFCGKPADTKTKEHIIPRWLIKLSKRGKVAVDFGFDHSVSPPKRRVFRFEQLVLPACQVCNEDSGLLEDATKPVMLRLQNREAITCKDVDTILSWFDKVRIGLWLWDLTINSKLHNLTPKFYVNKRMDMKDRILYVVYLNNDYEGIGFAGTDTLFFRHSPSCFGLLFNNLAFINASYDYLVAGRVGFPYAEHLTGYSDDRLLDAFLKGGEFCITSPMLEIRLDTPGRLFGQCIYEQEVKHSFLLHNNEYVRSNSLQNQNRSIIFVEVDGVVRPFGNDDDREARWITRGPLYDQEFAFTLAADVLRIQRLLLHRWPDTTKSENDYQKIVKLQKTSSLIELNDLIDQINRRDELYRLSRGRVIRPYLPTL